MDKPTAKREGVVVVAGIDLAKNVFGVHGVDRHGRPLLRRVRPWQRKARLQHTRLSLELMPVFKRPNARDIHLRSGTDSRSALRCPDTLEVAFSIVPGFALTVAITRCKLFTGLVVIHSALVDDEIHVSTWEKRVEDSPRPHHADRVAYSGDISISLFIIIAVTDSIFSFKSVCLYFVNLFISLFREFSFCS